MEARYYLTCLWPGLPELWWRGRLSGLPAAIGFTLALNLLLTARYLYPDWMAAGLVSLATWVGILVWLSYVIHATRELPTLIAPRSVSDEPDRFSEAHAAYLRGDWTEAERLLLQVLAIEPRDPPALLLLTGAYRHLGKLDAAKVLLKEMTTLEVADGWLVELEAEAQRLKAAIEAADAESSDQSDAQPDKKSDAADLTDDLPKAA